MARYFSADTGAFYDEDVHGPLLIDGEQSPAQIAAGKRPPKVPNQATLIPPDAKLVTDDDYLRLFAEQRAGKDIIARGKRPVAVEVATADPETQRAIVRSQRDVLLASTDIIVAVPDYEVNGAPLTTEQREELLDYRAALRALPSTLDPDEPLASAVFPPRPVFLLANGEIP